ncbi:CpaF family protein [Glutamicibacter soli]
MSTPDDLKGLGNLFKDLPLAESLDTEPPAAAHHLANATRRTTQTPAAQGHSESSATEDNELPRRRDQRRQQQQAVIADGVVDFEVIDTLSSEISVRRSNANETPQNREELGRSIIADVVSEYDSSQVRAGQERLTNSERELLERVLFDQAYQLGALQKYLDDQRVENIHINGYDRVMIKYTDGTREFVDPIASSDDALIEMVQAWSNELGDGSREFNVNTPRLSLTLPGKQRLQAQHPPIVPRPTLVIRCHRMFSVTMDDLVEQGFITKEASDFLTACVKAKQSIVVAGYPGAGKTTFLRALCSVFDPMENICTIETERELHLGEPNHLDVKSLEARPGRGERDPKTGEEIGAITLDMLLDDSLRLDVERILLGEVRSDEVNAMFKAFAGAAGSMTTIHARNGKDTIAKLAALQQKALGTSPTFAYRQISDHIQVIVHLSRYVGIGTQTRIVDEISEVRPSGDGEAPIATKIFEAPARGLSVVPDELPSDELLEELHFTGYKHPTERAGA